MRRAFTLAACAALAAPAVAQAHVDVLPTRIVEGQATEFTVRVPNERPGLATTRVRIVFPDAVTVYSFRPPPSGWSMEAQAAPNGRIAGVTYVGTLSAERYQDFQFMGNAFSTGTGVWKAYQTYSDGKIKPWTEDPSAADDRQETGPTDPGPGSPLTVVAAGDAGAAPDAEGGTTAAPAAAPAEGGSRAGMWLGLAGVGVGALALVVSGLLWTTRPMRLPDDPPPRGR